MSNKLLEQPPEKARSIRISEATYQRLKEYKKTRGIPIAVALDQATKYYLDQVNDWAQRLGY